jgi:pimeloyl-ACP methyl ester carboxylesterase
MALKLNYHRAGSGEPLVLLHGIGSRWEVWQPVLARLEAQRDVIAPDLPGFGGSPLPRPGTPPGVQSLTQMVGEFLEELELAAPHVAGNSLGGWIALELAKRGRARSATALSPAGFQNGVEAVFQKSTMAATVRLARLATPRAEMLTAPALVRRIVFVQLTAHPERIPPADAAGHLRALARAPWFDETLTAINSERFAGGEQIAVPVTIAWGEHDRLLLPRQAARAQREIPRARLLTLCGCGHVPTHDDPEQVARVLLDGSSS